MRKLGTKTKVAAGAIAVAATMALGAALFPATPVRAADTATTGAATQVAAQSVQAVASARANAACNGYVDADGDGVCDTCGGKARGGHHGCGNYVDSDGDGYCDACTGGGSGYRNDSGTGNGACYVDEDGDGICDNRGTSTCGGAGVPVGTAHRGGNGSGGGNGGGHHGSGAGHHAGCR